MDLMTPEGGTIVWTAITFILLVIVLYKVAWKPILSMLDERELKISESLKAADQARLDAEQGAEKRQEILDEAKKEAQKILTEARRSAEKISEDMSQQAQSDAEKILARAKNEINSSRDKVVQEMRNLAVELSMAATEKMIQKSLSKEDHQAVINESMQKIESLS